MATNSYSENGRTPAPHGPYNANDDDHHQHDHHTNNGTDHSEASDQGEQPRYLAHPARGKAANFVINGDPFFPAKKIVYNPKHFQDLTHYLDYLTDKLEPNFGAVRKICTPHHGHRIRELRDIQENGMYVVAGKERFKPYQYDQITPYDRKRPQPLHYNGEPINYNRQYVTSGRIKKCETQSMIIKVWPNGEDLKGPRRVLLTPRIKPFTLPNVVAHVNEILKEDCLGTVERLYFLTGVQVSDIDQITHNGQYVACKRAEKFKRARYSEHGTKNLSTSPRPQRRLLAPLFPRSTHNLSQSSPEQSNPSTQSSVASNSNRRRGPYDDDRGYPMKPLHHTPSSERTSTFDLDKDQGGVFKAKQPNRNTQGARPVQEIGETKTDVPAQGYQHANGYSSYPNPRSRQPLPNAHRKPDTHREQSPDKTKEGYGNKKPKEPKSKQPPESRQIKQLSTGNRLQDEDNAATKIQAAFRGHEAREGRKYPKPPKEINHRRYDDHSEEHDKAVEIIQAAYRGHETREELKAGKQGGVQRKRSQHSPGSRPEEKDKAAAKIQAAYRGHQTRKELKSPQSSSQNKKVPQKKSPVSDDNKTKKEDVAAAKIQAGYRGYLTRKKLGKNQDQHRQPEEGNKKNQAATKIQAGYRGYQTRKELGSQASLNQKEQAAAKIQAGYRGYQTRKRSAVEKEAATKIQSGYRGHLARKDLESSQKVPAKDVVKDEEKEAAASKIQAGFRGHLTRKELASKRQTPERQNSYDQLDRENEAALKIQSHYRGYRARKDFAQRRATASDDKYWP